MIKNKLNKLLVIVFINIFFISNVFADGMCESGCKIKDKTPDVILEYISNNNKVIQNISNNLGKKDLPKMGLRIYNSLFNWSETESGFKYFLSNIDGDVPAPIKRDLELIDQQNEKLNYFLTKIIENGNSFGETDPKKICSGIEDNGKCVNFIGTDIEENIKRLIENNSRINLILRKELGFMGFKTVLGSDAYEKLFLVPNNFKSEIKQNYNKNTYRSCANCEGGSIFRVKKSIKNISNNFSNGDKGIDEWIEAWNLLLGINDNSDIKEQQLERNLLQEELARQGISSNNGQAVLNDLKNFNGNDFGFSIGNNLISNSFMNFIEEIQEPFKSSPVDNFSKTIANIKDNFPDKDTFQLDEITYSEKNLGDDTNVVAEIRKAVAKNMGIISRQNKNTDKLQGRIIQLHIDLTQTINTLDRIIPKTEKICNDQDTGNGKCSYR